jgi:hypothetical protein
LEAIYGGRNSLTHKTNNFSILQATESLITRLRIRRSDKGLDVVSFDIEQGQWSSQDGSLAAALKAFAVKHAMAEDQVYTVLPRHEMTARILELPSHDLSEIASMIKLSAEEYVPFPAHELVIDQHILHKTGGGESEVLVVFAHQDVVQSHLALLREAGLEPVQVFLSTACLVSAAMAARASKHQRYALVNLAAGGLEVIVMNGKRFEYGRAVASTQDWAAARGEAFLGLPDEKAFPGEGSEAAEELRVELRATLSAYRRESEDGEGVEAVYFASDWADVKPYCDDLEQEMAEECIPANLAGDLITQGADKAPRALVTALGAALLAQDRGEVSIRLLPKSVLSERERTGVKQKAVKYAALAACILLALAFLYGQAVYQRNAYVKYLEKRIAMVEPKAKNVLSKQKQLKILWNQVDRSDSVVELLADLCQLYPASDANVTHFIFTHAEKIELFGRAKNLQLVEKLTQDMVDAGKSTLPLFARAETVYDNKGIERTQEVRDFAIQIPFPNSETPRSEETDIE